jgi:LysR family transcriptional regulator, hca operon transcriptional activator
LVPTHVCSDIASGFSLILATNGFSLIPDYTKRLMRPLADAPARPQLAIAYRPLEHLPTQAVVAQIACQWAGAGAGSVVEFLAMNP